MWTVPPGSVLHEQLAAELELGYLTPVVDEELFRNPDDVLLWETPGIVNWALGSGAARNAAEAMFRSAEWLRLAARVRERRRTQSRAAFRATSG